MVLRNQTECRFTHTTASSSCVNMPRCQRIRRAGGQMTQIQSVSRYNRNPACNLHVTDEAPLGSEEAPQHRKAEGPEQVGRVGEVRGCSASKTYQTAVWALVPQDELDVEFEGVAASFWYRFGVASHNRTPCFTGTHAIPYRNCEPALLQRCYVQHAHDAAFAACCRASRCSPPRSRRSLFLHSALCVRLQVKFLTPP